MLKLPPLLICLLLGPSVMIAQTTDSLTGELPRDVEYMVEELSGSYEENVDASDLVQENSSTTFRRIDLNTPDPFILAEKIRLNSIQIQNLTTYLRNYGPLLTVYELKAIQGFDSATIQRILPVILLKPKEEKVSLNPFILMKQMKGTLLIRYGRILESQAGYFPAEDPQSNQDHYLGDPSRVLVRFNAKATGRVSLGLLAEKDAGEQLFKGTQKQGFDHYKAFLAITLNKVLRSLIIGDYQLGFGQGLTINTSAMMTSSRGLYQPYKFSNPIRPNTSSNESGGLRGIAADIKTGRFSWTLFLSGKKLDARLNTDDTTEQVEALITTGYHRTVGEISNKNRVQCLVYGGHASYKNHFLQVGATFLQSSFQSDFLPQNELYKRFMDPGGHMNAIGADFRLLLPHVMIFGEFTRRTGKDTGMITGMLWYANPRFRQTIVFYHYPPKFYNPFSCASGRHQPNNNEKGFSWSFEALLSKTLTCTGGVNLFWFPWISYRLDKPSAGSEFYLLSTFKPASHTQFTFRFICKNGIQNKSRPSEVIRSSAEISSFLFSAQLSYRASSKVFLKNQLYISFSQTDKIYGQPGYLFSADLQYRPGTWPMELIMRYALFDIRDYADRIYAYERDVLYAFSAPAYYSKGIRAYAMIRYALGDWLDIWIRYSRTRYIDQSTMGSGLDEILSPHKSDVKIQVRYRF